MAVLVPYMTFAGHESFSFLEPCTLLSAAVLLTGILSLFRHRLLNQSRSNNSISLMAAIAQTRPGLPPMRGSFERMLTYLRFHNKVAPIIHSPETTLLPMLSPQEQTELAYHPDSLPGGRWLQTPTGRIRVYEFGPEDGKPVLFIHGISTPSIVARDVLTSLSKKGCRVLTFDLPGRGYSECCRITPQDMRLYSAIILMVTTSSTVKGGFFPFNIIGYSLGGGITASFASQFPHLISSVVTISSSGLLPYELAPWGMKCSLLPWVPVWLADKLLTTKLKGEEEAPLEMTEATDTVAITRVVGIEPVDIFSVIRWQNRYHKGFMSGYVSSMRNAPIFDRVEEWCEIGRLFRERRFAGSNGEKPTGKMLVMYGEKDDITPPTLLGRIEQCVGRDHIKSVIVEGGGHEIIVYQWDQVLKEIVEFWGL
ncbi:hypothetical protein TWF694_002717 [Orbilia ellipsospora]|uniref:AB hydrolase-1 domain-containing protein n=1 Tax=Orbilia ellipsospora TaxID=2528407 RepID=A0AAV9X5F9_9PEZI